MRKFYTYRLSKVQDKATITIASTFSSEFYTKESITTQTTEKKTTTIPTPRMAHGKQFLFIVGNFPTT